MPRTIPISEQVEERSDKVIQPGDLTAALRNTNPMHMSGTWVIVYFGKVKAEIAGKPEEECSKEYFIRHQLFMLN